MLLISNNNNNNNNSYYYYFNYSNSNSNSDCTSNSHFSVWYTCTYACLTGVLGQRLTLHIAHSEAGGKETATIMKMSASHAPVSFHVIIIVVKGRACYGVDFYANFALLAGHGNNNSTT